MHNQKKRSGRVFDRHGHRKKRRLLNCLGKSLFGCLMKCDVSNFVCKSCGTRKIPLNRARLTKRCKCFIYEYGKKVSGVSADFFDDVARASDDESYNLVVFSTSSEALLVSNLARFRTNFSHCEVISDRCETDTDTDESTWLWADGIPLVINRTNHKMLPRKLKIDTSNKSPPSAEHKSPDECENSHHNGTCDSSASRNASFDETQTLLLTLIKNQTLKIEEQDRTITKQQLEIDVLTGSLPCVSVPVCSFLEDIAQAPAVSQLLSFAHNVPGLDLKL